MQGGVLTAKLNPRRFTQQLFFFFCNTTACLTGSELLFLEEMCFLMGYSTTKPQPLLLMHFYHGKIWTHT